MILKILFSLVPAIALLIYIYWNDRYEREPVSLLFKLYLSGFILAVPAYFIEKILMLFDVFNGYGSSLYLAFIVAGGTEEYFKRLAVLIFAYNNRNYNEKLDGIVYCAFSALGFASAENIIYIMGSIGNFLYLGIARGVFAVPAHMLFGITMGYYLSQSKFTCDKRKWKCNRIKSYYIPLILHGIYDFILMSHFGNMAIILILFLIYLWIVNIERLKQFAERSRTSYKFKNKK